MRTPNDEQLQVINELKKTLSCLQVPVRGKRSLWLGVFSISLRRVWQNRMKSFA